MVVLTSNVSHLSYLPLNLYLLIQCLGFAQMHCELNNLLVLTELPIEIWFETFFPHDVYELSCFHCLIMTWFCKGPSPK